MKKHIYVCLMLPALHAQGGLAASNSGFHLKEIHINQNKAPGEDTGWLEGSCHIFDGYGASLQISNLRYQVSKQNELMVEMQPEGPERRRLGQFVSRLRKEDSGHQIVLMVNREIADVPPQASFFPRWQPVPLPGQASVKNLASLTGLASEHPEPSPG